MSSDTPLSFLAPSSIAIVGASKDPGKRGYQALRLLIADAFEGQVYPINPKVDEILGVPCFASIEELPEAPELALVCTPAKTLPEIIEQCGQKGIKGAVILGGGFSEAGEEGAGYERDMLANAKKYGVRLIGPNTSGCFNLHRRMNLAGIPNVKPGGLGLITQSGNMALSITTQASAAGHLGFSTYVGVGNMVDVNFSEYLAYLDADENTKVPVMYVEGFKDGRSFLDKARHVTPRKPIVLYKAGRTELGQSSAQSHTGSLAGSYGMARDLLHQSGVIVARRSDHIVPMAEALRVCPTPKGNRVAILADGGGHATIAADSLAEEGVLQMADLSEETRNRLAAILPDAASVTNPIDVAGGTDTDTGVFADCTSILLEDDGVDAVLIAGLIGGYAMRFNPAMLAQENETSIRLAALQRRHKKPIIVQSLYQPLNPEPLVTLREGGIPVQDSTEIAVTCIAALVSYASNLDRLAAHAPYVRDQHPEAAQQILDFARADGRLSLLEHEAVDLVRAHGIDAPKNVVLRSPDDAGKAHEALAGQHLAMKIVSKDILHKTDAKGVKLGVVGEVEIRVAYDEIIANAKAYDPNAKIEGVLAVPMAEPGVEVILGCFRDPQYGPVIMFGMGGTLVEVLKDVSFRAIPLSKGDAAEMLNEIKLKKIFEGVRGAPPVDKEALLDLIQKVASLLHSHPEIDEIDFNPVFALPQGYSIADARIILKGGDK